MFETFGPSRMSRVLRSCRRACRERLAEAEKAFEDAVAAASGGLGRGLVEAGRDQFAAVKRSSRALFEPARAEAGRRAERRASRLRRRADACATGARQLREAAERVRSGAFDDGRRG